MSTPRIATRQGLRAAFDRLDSGSRSTLDGILFDGGSCAQIARRLGVRPSDVRAAALSGIRLLRPTVSRATDENDGALALRALDLLEPDEATAVNRMLINNHALLRQYRVYRDLVADLCMLSPATPSDHVFRRLMSSARLAACSKARGGWEP